MQSLDRDLDAMLRDPDAHDDAPTFDLLDDDDAIDRMLQDAEASPSARPSDPGAPSSTFDEFANDLSLTGLTPAPSETTADELQMEEIDEFGDLDEFADTPVAPSPSRAVTPTPPPSPPDDDLLLDEFDLSAEESKTAPRATAPASPPAQYFDDASDFDEFADGDTSADDFAATLDTVTQAASPRTAVPPVTPVPTPGSFAAPPEDWLSTVQAVVEDALAKENFNEIKRKLNEVQVKLVNYNPQATSVITEEVETLKNDIKKSHSGIERQQQKNRSQALLALGIAVVSFLAGAGAALFTLSVKSEVKQVKQQVTSLDDDFMAWQNKQPANFDPGAQVEQLNALQEKLGTLEQHVATLAAADASDAAPTEQNGAADAALKAHLEKLDQQFNQLNAQVQKLASAPVTKTTAPRTAVAETANEKPRAPVANKVIATQPRQPARRGESWNVNLISFRQAWYAERKAAEFGQRGFPTAISEVIINGEPWYRLRVGGFASKQAAETYADRAKKVLNLNSVWVDRGD